MGSPWLLRHPQTERMEYLILEFSFKEMFEESWTLWRKEYQDRAKGKEEEEDQKEKMKSQEGNKATPSPAIDKTKLQDDRAKKRAKLTPDGGSAGGARDGADDGDVATGSSGVGTSGQKHIGDPVEQKSAGEADEGQANAKDTQNTASKLKARINSSLPAAQQLAQHIQTDKSWNWAAHNENLGQLRQSMATLSDALSPFGKNLLVLDLKIMKKQTPEQSWIHELLEFNKREEDADVLQSWVSRLTCMHNSIQSSQAAAKATKQPRGRARQS